MASRFQLRWVQCVDQNHFASTFFYFFYFLLLLHLIFRCSNCLDFFFHLRRRSFWCYGINWILYLVLRGSIADNARRISAILSTATYVFDCFRWKQFPMLLSLSAPQVFILTLTNWIIYDVNGCYFWGGRGWNRLEFCWIGRKSICFDKYIYRMENSEENSNNPFN